ncbi:unnamed protein product, partial [Durusdinium trenchii]
VITMVRHQRRDVWAKMQLDRRKKQEEKATASEARQRRGGCGARGRSDESPEEAKEDAQNAYIDRVVGCPASWVETGDVDARHRRRSVRSGRRE